MALGPDFYAGCAVGAVAVRARRSYKKWGDSTVIPSRRTAFGVELIFGGFALVPPERSARLVEASIIWDYRTWLNLVFLVLAGFSSGASSRPAA